MENPSQDVVGRDYALALARLVGLDTSEQHMAEVGPQIERLHNSLLRLRQLDLADVEPAIVFRAGKE